MLKTLQASAQAQEMIADRTHDFEHVKKCLDHMEKNFIARFQNSPVILFGAMPSTNLQHIRPLAKGGGLFGTADLGAFTKAERLEVIAAFERTLAQARAFVEGTSE